MSKEYKYKGYTFYLTELRAEIHAERLSKSGNIISYKEQKNVYAIDGLKEAGTRPWLTTIEDCQDYIDAYISGEQRPLSNAGSKILSGRLNLGMTQQELGLKLGFSEAMAQKYISRWERSVRPIPIDKVKPLSEILNIDPAELLP